MTTIRSSVLATLVVTLAAAVATPGAHARSWTLEQALTRAVDTSPSLSSAAALARARQAELQQAGRWPNPTVGLETSDSVGKQTGDGGYELSKVFIGQPLPLGGRLNRAQEQARARWEAEQARLATRRLHIEFAAAERFHELQLAREQLDLAREFLLRAEEFQTIGARREQAGDLARLERLRLDLVREQAHQETETLEGTVSEVEAQFKAQLLLSPEASVAVSPLAGLPARPELDVSTVVERHPQRRAAAQEHLARLADGRLARAERLEDWVLGLEQERIVIGGRTDEVTKLSVLIPLPLWDRKGGRIEAAEARAEGAEADIRATEIELSAELIDAQTHLGHLIEQAEHHREQVLAPAGEVFSLTTQGFAAGEVDLLALIDATETYFAARSRQLRLLHDAWVEAAKLRKAAGHSLLDSPTLSTGRTR